MKRRDLWPVMPPDRLLTFDPDDWPGRGWDSYRLWKEARASYEQDRGWPGGIVERLRVEISERRRCLFGWSVGRDQ